MVKKCSSCTKPLSEFEVLFHNEAKSPDKLSCKCWRCCGAEEEFDKAQIEKKNYRAEIITCIIGIIVSIFVFFPIFLVGNEPITNPHMELYIILAVVIYYIVGTVSAFTIYTRRKKSTQTILDPLEQRYRTIYGMSTTEYISKERSDGAIVTEKVVRSGDETKDQWSWQDNTKKKTSFGMKLLNLYLWPFALLPLLIFVLVGGFFAVWVIPYLLFAIVRDQSIQKYRSKIPSNLIQAYKTSKANSTFSHLSFNDKVSFLVSKERCSTPQKASHSFSKNFTLDNSIEQRTPFFYKSYKDAAYMIVDYRKDISSDFGITFVIVKKSNNNFEKKMVIGHEFVSADAEQWKIDWQANGANISIINHIDWYEKKFESILNSKQSKDEILGE